MPTTDDFLARGNFFLPTTNILSNMDNSSYGRVPYLPYLPIPPLTSQPLIFSPAAFLNPFQSQSQPQAQAQTPPVKDCSKFEILTGKCPAITPEQAIDMITQEKISQGIPPAQARQDAIDEALEKKAKIPTMNQLLQRIFGVDYNTVKLYLLAFLALILILVFVVAIKR